MRAALFALQERQRRRGWQVLCCPPPRSPCECLLLPNPCSLKLRADGRSGSIARQCWGVGQAVIVRSRVARDMATPTMRAMSQHERRRWPRLHFAMTRNTALVVRNGAQRGATTTCCDLRYSTRRDGLRTTTRRVESSSTRRDGLRRRFVASDHPRRVAPVVRDLAILDA